MAAGRCRRRGGRGTDRACVGPTCLTGVIRLERRIVMKKEQAISAALHAAGRAPAICTTGYTCRIAQANFPRPENFYMVGSMGLAGAVGCSAGHRSVGGCVTFEIGDLGVQVVPAAGKAAQGGLGCPGAGRPDPPWAAGGSMA